MVLTGSIEHASLDEDPALMMCRSDPEVAHVAITDSSSMPENLQRLADDNAELRRAVEELSVLNDLARTIGGSSDADHVIRTIVRRSLDAVNAEQGVVTLAPDGDDASMRTLLRTRINSPSAGGENYHFNQSLLGWMQLNMKPLQIDDPAGDPRFQGVRWDEHVRSILCVPMTVRSRLIAVLTVFNKRGDGAFTEDDKRLLSIIASQSAQVVENARLRGQEQELERMRHELALASVIQGKLLPKENPSIDGYDIAGRTSQAQMVGGDFFDFVERSDGTWSITLGDVIGKGFPASLLMSNVHAMLRTLDQGVLSPDETLRIAGRLLFNSTDVDKYVTLVHATLDPGNHRFVYVNAGHVRPVVLHNDGSISRLEHRELMLGLKDDFPYTSAHVDLDRGDTVVIFSDGISEAIDAAGAEFGEERVGTLLGECAGMTVVEMIERLIAAVHDHSGGSAQQDDITVVVVRRI